MLHSKRSQTQDWSLNVWGWYSKMLFTLWFSFQIQTDIIEIYSKLINCQFIYVIETFYYCLIILLFNLISVILCCVTFIFVIIRTWQWCRMEGYMQIRTHCQMNITQEISQNVNDACIILTNSYTWLLMY